MADKKAQSLSEIWYITQRKGGAVYKTRRDYIAWVTVGHVSEDKNIIITSISTSLMVKLNFKTMRMVSQDTPDVVKVSDKELGYVYVEEKE